MNSFGYPGNGDKDNHVAYGCAGVAGCTEIPGPTPSDKIGGGVSAAFRFNVPIGVNDALYIGGGYSIGATADVFANVGQGSTCGLFGSSTRYQSIAGGSSFEPMSFLHKVLQFQNS